MHSFEEIRHQLEQVDSRALEESLQPLQDYRDQLIYQLGLMVYQQEMNQPMGVFPQQIAGILDSYYRLYHSQEILQKRWEEEQSLLCPNCGYQSEASDRFCGNCGTRLEGTREAVQPFPMKTCTVCQTENQLENRFCVCCSHAV
ncbi:zinc ribbon domain-containing protein [Streptococcus sp. DD13]|uniref:zinc ribbon domain-containing protein n=1 Tax=Streptococcus sp. DD13 TaxID=1777881 RepID=UPI000792BA84|nr:zinc ribbon domain-containing protein [Streptococcus sp. DD13]KXT78747.1 hypothetical protein STRDD13_00479 [Streptococcus sp. DD13]